MNGVIEFHYQHNLNVNLILRKPPAPKKNQRQQKIQYEFRAGDSIAYFVPMVHDRKVIVTAEEISEKEWERLHWQHSIWFGHHKGMKRNDQGGCPIAVGGK
jgi:predicted NUDIX family phosphoesterase